MFFSALANRTRLAIIDVLKEGPKNVSGIAEALDQDENTIVSNLNRLEHCALLQSEGSEKEKMYSLNLEIVNPLSELLAFHTQKNCPGLTKCIPREKLKEYLKAEAAKATFIEHA